LVVDGSGGAVFSGGLGATGSEPTGIMWPQLEQNLDAVGTCGNEHLGQDLIWRTRVMRKEEMTCVIQLLSRFDSAI
jgi:hypothetical protein